MTQDLCPPVDREALNQSNQRETHTGRSVKRTGIYYLLFALRISLLDIGLRLRLRLRFVHLYLLNINKYWIPLLDAMAT